MRDLTLAFCHGEQQHVLTEGLLQLGHSAQELGCTPGRGSEKVDQEAARVAASHPALYTHGCI